MDRGSVTSGAGFKAAFRATLVFAAVFIVAGFFAYRYVQQELRNGVIAQILDEVEFLRQIHSEGGQSQLIGTIEQVNESKIGKSHALGLFSADGSRLAGDVASIPSQPGWSVQRITLLPAATARTMPPDLTYELRTERLGRLTIVVGLTLENTLVQERRMLEAFAFLGLVLSAAFLAIGYFGSLQSYRKLAQMADKLDLVSRGQSETRLDVSRDNDQIDRVSRAMNLHLDRLSNLMTVTRATAAAIAHDLRTPLSRAILAVEHAIDLPDTTPQVRAALDDAEADLTRLNSIFDAILRISRLETNATKLDLRSVNLAALLAEIGDTFAAVAEDKGQTLTIKPTDPSLAVLTDAPMLAQLLANLTQNAISHCPLGTAITLGARGGHPGPVLFVSDTGPGIPQAELERVFDMFYQLDPNRVSGGNGLGLTLVKAVAERLGAKLALKDAEPGLTVEIELNADLTRSPSHTKL
ncbi:MAG: HAMP domain-containing histidine kinase [Candidatus Saccharibacteria bacterium]|nr:HAMP domain-containing histidine kinase [Pseudorhodobacter sp.]